MNIFNQNDYLDSPLSVSTLIGKAWILYRSNFFNTIKVLIVPSIIVCIASIFVQLPTVSPQAIPPFSFFCFSSCLIGIILLTLGTFLTNISCLCILEYYSNISQGKQYNIQKFFVFAKNNWGKIFPFSILITTELMIIDLLVLILTILFSFLTLIISALIAQKISIDDSFVLYSYLFVMNICLLISMILYTVIYFKIIIFSVEQLSIEKTFKTWFLLIPKNFLRFISFIVLFGLLEYILYLSLNMPNHIISFSDFILGEINPLQGIPIHLMVIYYIWSTAVLMILKPFELSAILLFYYDYKARTEGFDLHTHLKISKLEIIKI